MCNCSRSSMLLWNVDAVYLWCPSRLWPFEKLTPPFRYDLIWQLCALFAADFKKRVGTDHAKNYTQLCKLTSQLLDFGHFQKPPNSLVVFFPRNNANLTHSRSVDPRSVGGKRSVRFFYRFRQFRLAKKRCKSGETKAAWKRRLATPRCCWAAELGAAGLASSFVKIRRLPLRDLHVFSLSKASIESRKESRRKLPWAAQSFTLESEPEDQGGGTPSRRIPAIARHNYSPQVAVMPASLYPNPASLSLVGNLDNLIMMESSSSGSNSATATLSSGSSSMFDSNNAAEQIALQLALLQQQSSGSCHDHAHMASAADLLNGHGASGSLEDLKNSQRRSQNMTECVPVPSSEHVAEIVGRQGKKNKKRSLAFQHWHVASAGWRKPAAVVVVEPTPLNTQ